jgi:hypothetical protein
MPLLTKKNIEKITEVSVLNPLITLKKIRVFQAGEERINEYISMG